MSSAVAIGRDFTSGELRRLVSSDRWHRALRRVDLQRVIEERFGVIYHERTVGKILKQIGFSHISAAPGPFRP
jgi:transposase